MERQTHFSFKMNSKEYIVLAPAPPFIDILIQFTEIDRSEFQKLIHLIGTYQNDPRLVEMVRTAGDSSAKIPYLLDEKETAESILATLRHVAHPHVEYLRSLPEKMQATIHTLLSVNKVPTGFEMYAIPALLEIDRMQVEMVTELKQMMAGRSLAEQYYQANLKALRELDEEWPQIHRGEISYWYKSMPVPTHSTMQYEAAFEHERLRFLHEMCVIVHPPHSNDFKRFIPPVLQRPLPQNCPVPQTGTADWLIREVGKVGRHITRALLSIIKKNLEQEKISLEARNYELITQKSREALDEMISRLP